MKNKHILAALLIVLNNYSKDLKISKKVNVDSIIKIFEHTISGEILEVNGYKINIMSLDSCITNYENVRLKVENDEILSCDMNNSCIKIGCMRFKEPKNNAA